MNENKGPWYLLTGLVIGIALGLVYSWVVRPVQYTNTSPSSLRADYKDQYRAIIAAAYLANGDLLRARERLKLLQDEDLYRVLAEQAQRTLAGGGSPQEARGLGLLAVALGQAPPAVEQNSGQAPGSATPDAQGLPAPGRSETAVISPTEIPTSGTPNLETPAITPVVTDLGESGANPVSTTQFPTAAATQNQTAAVGATRTATATRTPGPTSTPLPTRTSTPTPGAPFVLDRQELVCDPDLEQASEQGLIQVQVYDSAGQPVPGVEAIINWEGGENHFFTGLKPEINPGYADFSMQPEIVYSLRLAEGGQIIPDLTAPECERSSGERYWGAWRLVFVQP